MIFDLTYAMICFYSIYLALEKDKENKRRCKENSWKYIKYSKRKEGNKMNDDYDEYLEHLYEEDDRKYEDEIFERLCER